MSETGYGVHVTIDVTSVESREEARSRVMRMLSNLPPNMRVSNVQVSRYEITPLSDTMNDVL